eukprot:g50144.t1
MTQQPARQVESTLPPYIPTKEETAKEEKQQQRVTLATTLQDPSWWHEWIKFSPLAWKMLTNKAQEFKETYLALVTTAQQEFYRPGSTRQLEDAWRMVEGRMTEDDRISHGRKDKTGDMETQQRGRREWVLRNPTSYQYYLQIAHSAHAERIFSEQDMKVHRTFGRLLEKTRMSQACLNRRRRFLQTHNLPPPLDSGSTSVIYKLAAEAGYRSPLSSESDEENPTLDSAPPESSHHGGVVVSVGGSEVLLPEHDECAVAGLWDVSTFAVSAMGGSCWLVWISRVTLGTTKGQALPDVESAADPTKPTPTSTLQDLNLEDVVDSEELRQAETQPPLTAAEEADVLLDMEEADEANVPQEEAFEGKSDIPSATPPDNALDQHPPPETTTTHEIQDNADTTDPRRTERGQRDALPPTQRGRPTAPGHQPAYPPLIHPDHRREATDPLKDQAPLHLPKTDAPIPVPSPWERDPLGTIRLEAQAHPGGRDERQVRTEKPRRELLSNRPISKDDRPLLRDSRHSRTTPRSEGSAPRRQSSGTSSSKQSPCQRRDRSSSRERRRLKRNDHARSRSQTRGRSRSRPRSPTRRSSPTQRTDGSRMANRPTEKPWDLQRRMGSGNKSRDRRDRPSGKRETSKHGTRPIETSSGGKRPIQEGASPLSKTHKRKRSPNQEPAKTHARPGDPRATPPIVTRKAKIRISKTTPRYAYAYDEGHRGLLPAEKERMETAAVPAGNNSHHLSTSRGLQDADGILTPGQDAAVPDA